MAEPTFDEQVATYLTSLTEYLDAMCARINPDDPTIIALRAELTALGATVPVPAT
jgi:hypothetical protein